MGAEAAPAADFKTKAQARVDWARKNGFPGGIDSTKYKVVLDPTHNMIFFSAKSDAELAAVRAELEGFAEYQWRVLFKKNPGELLCIVLLTTEDLGKANRAGLFGRTGGSACFAPNTNMLYVGDDPSVVPFQINLGVHEFTHALNTFDFRARGLGAPPLWFTEGLASLFEASDRVGDEYVPRLNGVRLNWLRIPNRRIVAWTQFMADPRAFIGNGSAQDVQSSYGQSRFMMFYMYEKGVLKKFYDTYADNLKAGKPDAAKAAVESVFGKPVDAVQADWIAWLDEKIKSVPQFVPGPLKPLAFKPPAEVFGGKALELTGITFKAVKPEDKVTGTLFWRRKGGTEFESVTVEPAGRNGYKATLPAEATQEAFEYYLSMQEAGGNPVCEPDAGANGPFAVTPDLTPPTAVPDLTATAKSYRVALRWTPATDDRKVAGYQVYRGAADKFAPDAKTLIGKAAAGAVEYADNAPTPKRSAWYAVRAIDAVGREGELRYLKVDVPGEQPPDALKLTVTPGSKAIVLSWPAELEPNVAAVEIYRGEGKDSALKKIGEITDLKITRFVDQATHPGTEYRYTVRPRSRTGLAGEYSQTVTASPLRYLRRINCGGPEVPSEDGVPWEADKVKPNSALQSDGTKVWTVPDPVKDTGPLKDIYQSERWANQSIGYAFDMEPGRYEVVLYFAETTASLSGKGKRTFDIVINGETVATKVDVFSEAGGPMTPWQFRKIIGVAGREITVGLTADPTGPAIKGIEIRGLAPGGR